jgi:hypothetical protein
MVVPGRENEQESGKTGGIRGGLTETIYILAPQVKAKLVSKGVHADPRLFFVLYCNQVFTVHLDPRGRIGTDVQPYHNDGIFVGILELLSVIVIAAILLIYGTHRRENPFR